MPAFLSKGVDGEVTEYVYEDANRLTSAGGVEYTWDGNGNLLDDGLRTYEYDYANRLIEVVSGAFTTRFVYNGDGHRVAKSENGVTTSYVVAILGLSQVLVETTGGQTTRYVYGHDLLAEYDGSAWAYHLNDGLGSVRQLADGGGDVTLAQGYTPFGVPLWSQGSGETGYGFTGEQWEAYSQLVFLRARYYEPGAGRFSSKDPLPGYVHRPQSLHVYVYAWNRPNQFTDPSGRQVPPQQCEPGHICVPPPTPSTPVWTVPGNTISTIIGWFVLHYLKPGDMSFRTETYLASLESPWTVLGGDVEVGFRAVQVYEPTQFRKVHEYDEVCVGGKLGVGLGPFGVGFGPEVTWTEEGLAPSGLALGASVDLEVVEVELQASEGLQATLYVDAPGPVVKMGYGLEMTPDIHRYLVASEKEVDKAGSYQTYGTRKLGPDYLFEGVEMRADNKTQLYLWWRTTRCNSYESCRLTQLEEIP